MAGQLLNLPVNIPWLQVAASPDMIDTEFCNKRFPFTWRSSLAMAIYEPTLEELPEELCDQRITYLKVTSSITGYQPSREETEEGYVRFPNVPTEAMDNIFAEYFACYGVLLNVAVFPSPTTRVALSQTDSINFSELQSDDAGLPNPLAIRGVSFEAGAGGTNRLVDLFPVGGDEVLELELPTELTVSLPQAAARVVARVVRTNPEPLRLVAFRGQEQVGEAAPGDELNTPQDLTIDATDIDRLVFTAASAGASLMELAYFEGERREIPLADFPHIVDVTPQVRDLYQAATESGEILTASQSGVKTDKTLTTTESTETGFKLGAEVPIPQVPGSKLTGEFSRKRTDTDQDQWSVATDASRERRETQGTTTQLSQLYNLLSAYHVGTNRATFLMLPRPHVLQPTDHRTFVQGLRFIEGIQEFMLIISRQRDIEGLSLEATLDTGHFPEDVVITEPEEEFDESSETFTTTAFADNSNVQQNCEDIDDDPTSTYTIDQSSGWVIDKREKRRRQPGAPAGSGWDVDPDRPGIAEIANDSNGQANDSLDSYEYRATSDISAGVFGRICGERWQGDKARFRRTYRVFTRSPQPKPSSAGDAVETPFLITSRSLCARFRSADPCPVVMPVRIRPPFDRPETFVDEGVIKLSAVVLTRSATAEGRSPAVKDLLRKIHNKMATSWRLRTRYPAGEIGFLASDFFANRLRENLPGSELTKPLREVEGISASVVSALGEQGTVAEAVGLSLADLAKRTGMTLPDAAQLRQQLLTGTAIDRGNPPKSTSTE